METTKMIIRPERVADYPKIGALHAHAFGNRPGEALLVALLRQRRAFDPELSLVAEIEGRVVGHVLFSPYHMRLLDSTVPTVNLAPLAVDPAYQGLSIGGQLIARGHSIAAARGYKVSILLGHPTYYPRFGYHMHAFGSAQLLLPVNTLLDANHELLDVRSPTNEDVAELYRLWEHEEGAVDMALEPGLDLLDWLSPNLAVQATIYIRNNEMVGYTRISAAEPTRPHVFLARDSEAAKAMVATMAHKLESDTARAEYVLPLHPLSTSAQAFGHATCKPSAAAMACSLAPSPLDDYLAQVRNGQRLPGRPGWPVAFDLA